MKRGLIIATGPLCLILPTLCVLWSHPGAAITSADDLSPIRPDFVAHFSSGTAVVTVNTEEPATADVASGVVWLSTNDSKCRPSASTSCKFNIARFELQTEPFDVAGIHVDGVRVSLPAPAYGQLDTPGGMHINPAVRFTASGTLDDSAQPDDPFSLFVSPSPTDLLDVQFDLDSQTLSINGRLEGHVPDFDIQLALIANAASPFENVPPNVNAGPDLSVSDNGCFASVQLDKSGISDPNGNLSTSFVKEASAYVGTLDSPIKVPAGNHTLTVKARDEMGAMASDVVVVHVTPSSASTTVPGSQHLAILTPPGVSANAVAAGASHSLTISPSAIVRPTTGGPQANLLALGTTSTELGASSNITGNVWSRPTVNMRSHSRVFGSLYTVGTVQKQDDTLVSGSTVLDASFAPTTETSWNFQVPSTLTALNGLEPDQTLDLVTGAYSQLTIKSRSKVTLHAGTYVFGSVDVEPQAIIDPVGNGPVLIYVKGGTIFRGTINTGSGKAPVVLVGLGTSSVTLESSFTGTVVAPSASLSMAGSGSTLYRGAFFAADINLAAGAILEFVPQSFDFVSAAKQSCALTPLVRCVETHTGGFKAHFGYANALDSYGVFVPIGPFNALAPGPQDQGQPTNFGNADIASKSGADFTVDTTASALTWTLGAHTVTATASSPRCN